MIMFMKQYLKIAAVIFTICTATLMSCDKNNETGSYTVTFDVAGGSPIPSTQNVEAGEMATVPVTNPTKSGYVFLFWHLSGASTAYHFNTPVHSNITLQAKWEEEAKVEYWQVSWELNDGSWPSTGDHHATQVVKGGALAEPAVPVKAGCTFDGWYKESTLTNKVSFPYDVSAITANFTLYAKWHEILPALTGTVTITGSAVVGQTLTANTENLGGAGTISYQWKRYDTENAAGTDITQNGTGNTYTLAEADLGKFIKVTVVRSGNSGSRTSEATVAIINTPSAVKAEWYSGGSIIGLFNPLRSVYYIKWPTVQGADSYVLYKSASTTGVRTLVRETSDLSINGAEEILTTSGTHIRYYWVVATINGEETPRPVNGGIKVTYTVTLAQKVWMPNSTPPLYGYWMTIGVDNINRVVEQNPIR